MKPKSTLRPFLLLVGSSLLAISAAHSATLTWDSTAGGVINDGAGAWLGAGQWNDGTPSITWTAGDDAIFGNGGVGGAVTLASPTTVNSLTFNTFITTGYTLGTAGQTITLNAGIAMNAGAGAATIISPITLSAAQSWLNNSSNLLTVGTGAVDNDGFLLTVGGSGSTAITSVVSDLGGLTKQDAGLLTLSGANTYGGATSITGGALRLSSANALPGGIAAAGGTSNLLMNGGYVEMASANFARGLGTGVTQVQITGGTSGFSARSAARTVNLGAAVTWGSANFSPSTLVLNGATADNTLDFQNAIDLGGSTQTVSVGANTATLSGILSNGGLTKNGNGQLNLTAANTYAGSTTINGGILKFLSTAAMPSSGNITVNTGATLAVDVNGTGRFTNATSGAGSFGGILAGVGTGTSTVTYSGDVAVGIDISVNALAVTYSGVIANPVGSTSLTLRKINGQNLTLTGANTYSGKTILGGGSVVASSFGNIADASSPLGTNSTIDFLTGGNITFNGTTVQSSDKTFNIAQGDATLRADGTGVGAITLTANINPTSTSNKSLSLFGANTNANTISGVISNGAGGALNVIKNLAGTWILSGTNTYSGGTTLSAGTLVSVGASGLGSGAITFNTSSTSLQFRNDTNTSVANAWTAGGQSINNTLVVDRVTAGAAADLTLTQQYNRANSAVFNFQKGSNVTSGTPTITFSGGFTNTDSTNATIGGSGSTGPNTFNPTGVNLVINGIAASARTKAYVFQGDTTGNRVTGTFANGTGTSIRKAGTGTWTFAGTIQYTGTTEITGGTLAMGANNVLPTAAISIGNGILDAATFDDTTGTLDVTSTAAINLGVGANLAFADSDAIDWTGGTLNVTGTLAATSLRFGTDATGLTPTQLALISVNGAGLGTYVLDAMGYLIAGGGGPGPLDHFAISAISSPQTVGTPITGITLTAQDAANATVTSFTGTVNFGGTGGFSGTSATFTAGVLSGVSVTPTNAGSGLTFTVTDIGTGKTGSATITTIQTQYAFWSGGANFDDDANNDGIDNGLAFLLGASSPTAAVTLPTVSHSSGNLVLTFNMLNAANRGSASIKLQQSSDLSITDTWVESAVVPDIAGLSPAVNGVTFNVTLGSPTNGVVATVAASEALPGTKLFGRLKAEQ